MGGTAIGECCFYLVEWLLGIVAWVLNAWHVKEVDTCLPDSFQTSDAFSPFVIAAMILLGIWNLHKGDYRSKMLAWNCRQDPDNYLDWNVKHFRGTTCPNIGRTLARFARNHVQVGIGLGMLMAAVTGGFYSSLGSLGYLLIRILFNGFVTVVTESFLPFILSAGCGSVVAYVFNSFA